MQEDPQVLDPLLREAVIPCRANIEDGIANLFIAKCGFFLLGFILHMFFFPLSFWFIPG